MRHVMTALLIVLALAAAADAEYAIAFYNITDAVMTPGLAGYTTYEISVFPSGPLEGVDLELTTVGNDLHHVYVGSSVFANLNPAMPEPLQDTQVPWVDGADVVGGGVENESYIAATWGFLGGPAPTEPDGAVPILQFVLRDGGVIDSWWGQATVGGELCELRTPIIEWIAVAIVGEEHTIGPGESIDLYSRIINGLGFSVPNFPLSWSVDSWPDEYSGDHFGSSWSLSYDYLVNTRGLALGEHAVNLRAVNVDTGDSGGYSFDITIVPEPATLALLAIGGVALLIRRRA